MMGFNLMSLLRKLMLKKQPHHTLKTLRYKLFARAGYVAGHGRQRLLTLALDMKKPGLTASGNSQKPLGILSYSSLFST
jgi:hypothetical protein